MDIVFFEFYCSCGKYLFQTVDIENSVMTTSGTNYIFVKDKQNSVVSWNIDLNQYRNGVKTINCKDCGFALGGYVYRQHQHEENLFRFIRNRILRKKVTINFPEAVVRESPFVYIPRNSTAVTPPIPSLMSVHTSGDISTPEEVITNFFRYPTSDEN